MGSDNQLIGIIDFSRFGLRRADPEPTSRIDVMQRF